MFRGAPLPMPTLTADALVRHLRQLTSEGGADNRLVVASRDYYMVFSGRRGEPELQVEAVANSDLPRAAELTPARLAQLTQRRFSARPGRNNLHRTLPATAGDDLQTFAAEVLQIFAKAYGVDEGEPAEFDLQLGDPEPTRNPDLLRLMRLLSIRRDWDTRKLVYQALLATSLLLAIDPDNGGEPLEAGKLGQLPSWAAFTDIDALRLWQPKGAPFRTTRVDELVPRAVDKRIGSLLINPKGNVGGELYINELESLYGAIQRRSSVL